MNIGFPHPGAVFTVFIFPSDHLGQNIEAAADGICFVAALMHLKPAQLDLQSAEMLAQVLLSKPHCINQHRLRKGVVIIHPPGCFELIQQIAQRQVKHRRLAVVNLGAAVPALQHRNRSGNVWISRGIEMQ